MCPRATYRVQLHAGFTFDDATAIVDYLSALGISHLYCSPYLQAASGSTHGYDVVDHSRLNAELGGAQAHTRLVAALKERGMSQVLDIVPNHMDRGGRDNAWWWDVLENGPASRYATYFDIDWDGEEEKSRHTVLVPILGDAFGRVLEAGDLALVRDGGSVLVRYADHELPLSARTLDDVLRSASAQAGPGSAELAVLAEDFATLPHARLTDRTAVLERHERKELLTERLAHLCSVEAAAGRAVDDALTELAKNADAFDALLSRQNFRLAHWRTASEELDYRRFFSIDNLIGLQIDEDAVFDATHALVLDLVRRGAVTGLRVDHVDGLRDPEGYLHRLSRANGGTYTVVEKILGPSERVPASWPVAGTSGYEFISVVNDVMVDPDSAAGLDRAYAAFLGEDAGPSELDCAAVERAAKLDVMHGELATEIDRLTRVLSALCQRHRRHRDHTRRELRAALTELIAAFGVYRTYVHPSRAVTDADRTQVNSALERAQQARPDIDTELLAFLGELLLLRHPGEDETEFALRFPQVCAPVMAKGVEDTAFYRYQRLISLNEVGGHPALVGRPVAAFHARAVAAARERPTAMLTLSTHDTKRSADTRARINLLAEITEAWARATARWSAHNTRHRRGPTPRTAPDRATEYLLYQTLVGTWPIESGRVVDFMTKAAREAKVHTSWSDPDQEYDEALAEFCFGVLADAEFCADLESFIAEHRLLERGHLASLAQLTLLLTWPGVPDIYQGEELWNYTLVDPDNRRGVDYAERARLAAQLGRADAATALTHSDDGGTKLWLMQRLLTDRRDFTPRYTSPDYEPVIARGRKAAHALAFRRGDLLVVVPRLLIGLGEDWADATLDLPTGQWRDVLTDARRRGGEVEVGQLLAQFPVAVLAREY
ncbi:MAG: malto-oligosyltrehalose synthase [Sporichthyaceae bacterium]